MSYTYDEAGNVLTQTDGDGNTTTNAYDGNQLISTVVTDASNKVISSMSYTYDEAGNVLTPDRRRRQHHDQRLRRQPVDEHGRHRQPATRSSAR